MKICQVINALDRADAVSLHLLETDQMLRALGHETQIFYEFAHRSLASRGRPIAELRPDGGDMVLFHYAGFSRILARVARFQGKRGVVFHNVTPAHFFEDVPETYEFCERAVAQIPELARWFDFGVGVSAFNARTLQEHGFEATRVQPIAWETSGVADAVPDPRVAEAEQGGPTTLLMVGRVAPHKGAHFAVAAHAQIEAALGGPVRLLLVGKTGGYDAYLSRLRTSIEQSGARDRIVLTGEVSTAELRAYYESADLLLQLSEHEGFCVPLVEAMSLGLPVVAAPAGAIEETLGDAGLLVRDRSPEEIARGVAEALGPARHRIEIAQSERRRLFSRQTVQDSLARLLDWAAAVPRREPPKSLPDVSVVVCTYNRAGVLGKCLEGLRRLDYPRFEVVVVEGPSTDGTRELLDGYPDVTRVQNETRNLSISRNLGIAASAGEIVAFIDDDAVPDRSWLRELVSSYDDPTVGAAGGDVFGPGGDHLQFSNGILSRYGRVVAHQEEPDDRNDPGGAWFNTLMGTNSSFRRRALDAVGGFDENYEYYHDEADLCARVVQAGYRVAHVPRAVVWHGFEPGTARKSAFEFDFTVIVKNTIYYAACVSGWERRPWRAVGPLADVSKHALRILRWLVRGKIGLRQAMVGWSGWARGIVQGYRKALSVDPRRDLALRLPDPPPELVPYGKATAAPGRERLHVALISQQYPPDACGGIGVYTEQLARGLVEAGHRVSVVAAGEVAALQEGDGVEIYRIPPSEAPAGISLRLRVTRKNVARSLAVQQVVQGLARTAGVSLVESPIWDAEGYATALAGEVPLVLRLNTPLALAAETQGWEVGPDLHVAAKLEWALLRAAQGVIDPSGTILETLSSRFDVRPGSVPTASIPFGVPLPPERSRVERDSVRFLFLGRLERRKGIDTLLAAIPSVLDACPEAFFEIAGEAPASTTPESLAASFSPAHRARVRFHGFVDDDERERLYRDADVFVAPSRYESFGIVYLEAMSHGLPCVACDIGGAGQILRSGETGGLVPPEDAPALAAALVDLARTSEHRLAMGHAARAEIVRNYSVSTMVERTLELYRAVLDRAERERRAVA